MLTTRALSENVCPASQRALVLFPSGLQLPDGHYHKISSRSPRIVVHQDVIIVFSFPPKLTAPNRVQAQFRDQNYFYSQ